MWSEVDQLHFFDEIYFIRDEKLNNIVAVSSGIRLYNKYCGKGGNGIPDRKFIFLSF